MAHYRASLVAPLLALAVLANGSACVLLDEGLPDGGRGGEDGGETGARRVQLAGAVAKGPFVLGSSVTLAPLDEDFLPAGQVFPTSTKNDLGEFDLTLGISPEGLRARVEGTGFFYDEISGGLSGAPLTLRAFAFVQQDGPYEIYVNILTHLIGPRVQHLLRSAAGGTEAFVSAIAQAERELVRALRLGPAEFELDTTATSLNVVGHSTADAAYLLLVSSVFAQAAVERANEGAGSVDALLQELLNTVAADFEQDGILSTELVAELAAAQAGVDGWHVMERMRARLRSIGRSDLAVPDLHRVLDNNNDGIPNAVDGFPCGDGVPHPDRLCLTYETRQHPGSRYPSRGRLLVDLDRDGKLDLLSADFGEALTYGRGDGLGGFHLMEQLRLAPGSGAPLDIKRLATGVLGPEGENRHLDIVGVETGGRVVVVLGKPLGDATRTNWAKLLPAVANTMMHDVLLTRAEAGKLSNLVACGEWEEKDRFTQNGVNQFAIYLNREGVLGTGGQPDHFIRLGPDQWATNPVLADMDGDGVDDLLFAINEWDVERQPGQVSMMYRKSLVAVLPGLESGGFSAGVIATDLGKLGSLLTQVIAANVEGDERLEVVAFGGSELRVLSWNGDGWVTRQSGTPDWTEAGRIAAVDLQQDGFVDLVVTGRREIRAFLGTADGPGLHDAPVMLYENQSVTFSCAWGEWGQLNEDGYPDLFCDSGRFVTRH